MLGRRNSRALGGLEQQVGDLRQAIEAVGREVHGELARIADMLQVVYDEEPANRRRLAALRASEAYHRAFDDPEPLVSVAIPTYNAHEMLRTRSIPSVLAQTYANIEVVVVGDCSPPDTQRILAAFEDPRIVFRNLTVRGPYPADRRGLWHVAGTHPRNEAVRSSRGLWVAPLDDDDEFRPDHVERLLGEAQKRHTEVCYGKLRCVMGDAEDFDLGVFPPRFGQFGWQGAIFHSGLRFFEAELADAIFGSPGDWSICRRMLRAGVSFSMLDAVVVDHYESKFSPAEDEAH